MYSRLANHDRRQILRHIVLFFGATAGLSLLFLLVILPAFIRILALKNLGTKIAIEEPETLPVRPFLRAPFEATSSATVSLTGNAQAGQKVLLLIGGVPGPEVKSSDDGSFHFDQVGLESGSNTFTAVSETDKGTRSNPSSEVVVSYVKDAPTLEITNPTAETTITQRKANPITVTGKTNPGNKIYINDGLKFVSSDGSFTAKVQLTEGDNTIVVKALNPAQVETIQEILVHFQP